MKPCHTSIVMILIGIQHYGVHKKTYDVVQGNFVIPNLPRRQFVQEGDINIGAMVPMSRYDRDMFCSDVLNTLTSARYPQAIAFAVEKVNEARILPNNLTLGFVILDDCRNENGAVAQSLAFLPQTTCPVDPADPDAMPSHDVVAVIGSTNSPQSVAVAHVLGPAQLPMASFFSTSDDLSNKELFPYFMRTLSPDKFQFRAMFHIIKQHGWTYVSVVHVTGSYGENGFKQLRDLFDQNGICLAVVRKISRQMTVDEAEDVAEDLVAHSNARVVIVISSRDNAQKIIAATGRLSPSGSFLWMASDAWANSPTYMTDLGDLLLDAFLVSPMVADIEEFEERFMNLRPNDTADPWFPEYWERLFNCSLQDGTCNTTLTAHEANASDNRPTTFSGHIIDTVFMLANATARVLAASPGCEVVTGRGARACVTGPRLLSELKATRQNGYTGWLELDANGDRLGRYVIKQVVPDPVNVYDTVVVAEFDSLTRKMTLTNNVTWFYHAPLPGQDHPESKCSHPCAAHEARVMQEVTCCWLCHPCRVNDRLAFNGTRCEACPPFTWPDPDTDKSTCLAIPPDTPRLDSVMGAVQTALAFLCLLVCLLVFIFFHRHRSCRVIKASSRELSFLMLLAIAMGYVVMVTMVAPPTDLTCRLNFLLFCLSFTLLYGPLLVRALRIFRIFEASKRSARRPRFIESGHQIIFSFAFIAVQVVMCVVMMLEHPEWHRLSQSSPQEYYVELSCEFPQAALASFLVYNVLLVAVCTLLAFKTRRLPDNFNESRFISMCVSTKLVVLCCFVPAYLVSQRQLLRMLMLALALALNHSVALVFLFLPKIYAVCYLEGAGDINQTTVHGGGAGGVTRSMNGTTTETGTGGPGPGGRPRVSMMNVSLPRIGESHVESEHAQHNGSGVFDSEDKAAPNFNQIHPV